MTKTTAYLEAADGRRIEYTPSPHFIPTGSLSVELDVWQRALPGAGWAQWGRGETTELAPHVFRWEGSVTFGRNEKGADGVWREVPGSEVTFRHVVIQDYSSLYSGN